MEVLTHAFSYKIIFKTLTFNKITHKRLCVTPLPGQYVPRSFLFLMEVLTHAFSYKIIFKTLTFNKITHKRLCVTLLPGQYVPRSFLFLKSSSRSCISTLTACRVRSNMDLSADSLDDCNVMTSVFNIFSSTLSTFRGWGGRERREIIFIVQFPTYVIAKSYVLNIFSSTLSTFRGWGGGGGGGERREITSFTM